MPIRDSGIMSPLTWRLPAATSDFCFYHGYRPGLVRTEVFPEEPPAGTCVGRENKSVTPQHRGLIGKDYGCLKASPISTSVCPKSLVEGLRFLYRLEMI